MLVESPNMTALRRVTGLRYLSPGDFEALASAAADLTVPAGAVVQHAGPADPSLAVVVEGVASVWRTSKRVGEVGPGEFIANRPPLDVLTRGARVVAETPMRLLSLPVDLFTGMLDDTALAATMLDSALARLRRVSAPASAAPMDEVHPRLEDHFSG